MTDLRKDSVTFVTVDDAGHDQRVDNFLLRHLEGVPKSHVYRILRSGEVRVNKGRVDASHRLQHGDVLRIPPVRVAQSATPAGRAAPAQEFAIVYEDDALLVIDKPAGVAVHGGSGVSFGVIEQLRAARPEARFLELVHRLDRETSGLLMLAKKRSALVKLHEMIRDNHMDKRYQALGVGDWPEARKQVKLPLLKFNLPDGERRVRVADDGQHAHTNFRVLKRASGFVLLEAQLKTGRTHQIRVHMQKAGHPLAGDPLYGNPRHAMSDAAREAVNLLGRQALHAFRLALVHPATGETMQWKSRLPADMRALLTVLRSEMHGKALPLDDDDFDDEDDGDWEIIYTREE